MAVLAAEQRTLGTAAREAMKREKFAEAQSILQSLNELWDARGLREEAQAWVDRCRTALEGSSGQPPNLETQAGALWLFMVGVQANRSLQAGALSDAEAEYEALRQVLERSGDEGVRRHLSVIYHQLGNLACVRGNLPEAETWYRKSLKINEALGDRSAMADSYHQLGVLAISRGDLHAAETWYLKSLEMNEVLGNQPSVADSYHELGNVALARGNLPQAETWYRNSMKIYQALGDRPKLAGSYHQLGRVAQDCGDLQAAEAWYCKALEIREALGDRPGMAASYHQLGMVAHALGGLSTAESWYRKSLEINEALGDRLGMALSYGQLGLLTEDCGDKAAALGWMVRCVALFPEFPHPSTGPGPQILAGLTAELGMRALEASWQRCTGEPLPDEVRGWVAARLEES
jgi:tetratricopeptide (TPR) repeat protein